MRKDSGLDVVVVGARDDDKSVNRGAGGCSEVEEGSRDLVGCCQSKEEEVDESGSRAQAVTDGSIIIDVKPQRGLGERLDREKLCRICHLSSEPGSNTNALKVAGKDSHAGNYTEELILLGCGCKDELGMAHRRCAEAWFKLKRSRLCEICGETAKNVSGVVDNRFMEEWNDGQGHAGTSTSSPEGGGGWSWPPFCNLLMACVVMAFILPWFFFPVDLF